MCWYLPCNYFSRKAEEESPQSDTGLQHLLEFVDAFVFICGLLPYNFCGSAVGTSQKEVGESKSIFPLTSVLPRFLSPSLRNFY